MFKHERKIRPKIFFLGHRYFFRTHWRGLYFSDVAGHHKIKPVVETTGDLDCLPYEGTKIIIQCCLNVSALFS
jgi:hypothetical protein